MASEDKKTAAVPKEEVFGDTILTKVSYAEES